MRLLVTDLDGTVIHSRARLAPGVQAQSIEIYQEREITCAYPETLAVLTGLAGRGAFVPCTTRSQAQLRRVEPIWALAERGWAICANGAMLLHRGEPDPAWTAAVDRACAVSVPLEDAMAAVERELGTPDTVPWMRLLRGCEDRFLYAVLEPGEFPAGIEADAAALLEPLGWRAILHHRKLYALPNGLGKEHAVAELRDRLGASAVMSGGDSLLDRELLEVADRAICPRDGELVTLGRVPAGVELTTGTHVDAGLEIARVAEQWVAAVAVSPGGATAQ